MMSTKLLGPGANTNVSIYTHTLSLSLVCVVAIQTFLPLVEKHSLCGAVHFRGARSAEVFLKVF